MGLLSRHGLSKVGNICTTEDTKKKCILFNLILFNCINILINSCNCYYEAGIVSNLDLESQGEV